MRTGWLLALPLIFVAVVPAVAAQFDAKEAANIDAIAGEWLTQSEAPSVSIAIVRGGAVAYTKAYGKARLDPVEPATPSTRYAIDSVSKEFTAAAILLLAEQGKLSLDDRIEKWFPELTAAGQVTLRQILTHTAGIRDFWPQDFVPPEMTRPTAPDQIVSEWADRPLDFEPGTDFQYSNTGYVIAGRIVEKISGQALPAFLESNIFAKLGMKRVTEDDTAPLGPDDAGGYTRHGLGPIVPAPKEARGWLFGASALAMQPSDLALWDISLINRALLKPNSYDEELKSVVLKNGTDKHYGLGFFVDDDNGRRLVEHDGAGSGYLAENYIWPDQKTAIVVLTNGDWTHPDDLVGRLALAVLPYPAQQRAAKVFADFQRGMVDRSLFTDNGNAYLTDRALADLKSSLGLLGPARVIRLENEKNRGGMVTRRWTIICPGRRLFAIERGYPNGKLEQFIVYPAPD